MYNLKWMIIVLLNYGCRDMEMLDIPAYWLRPIQGLVVDGALLSSVRTSRGREMGEQQCTHTVAAVHTTMCIPEQHREPTTRVITRVE